MQTFTEVLNNFLIILEKIPKNLKPMTITLLFFLSTIEIALTIYNNIDNPQFQYLKWGKTKILKIGFIIFTIQKYETIIKAIKSFFLEIGTKGLGLSLVSSDYFNKPSMIVDQGIELFKILIGEVSITPKTYGFLFLAIFVVIGFFIIAIQIVITWIEFYFLTGISIVFLPFGALDMTGEYYKNVFKTIMSCSIKLCVFNIWILASDKIIRNLLEYSGKNMKYEDTLIICGTTFVLVAIIQTLPSMTAGLLTGSPQMNAGVAMSAAIGAGAALATNAYHTARMAGKAGKEVGGSIKERTVQGAQKGAIHGTKFGGPTGAIVGTFVGAGAGFVAGGIEGGVKGAYAAGKYGINQGLLKKPEYSSGSSKPAKESSKEKSKDSSNSSAPKPSTNVSGKDTKTPDYSNMSYQEILQSASNDEKTNLKGTDGPTVNGEKKVPDWMQ
ncbi:type IV secretion system protein [Fusobacterium necrophorum]|uniref:type IV secretion system protein n=1 Tax=Fusobacterium necrophorum TaxID=859 RepID=UPI0007883A59|nr:type IV secretion system protein [Fusobacterium necrophorum]KYM42219.1 conjugal transfer protein TrbL [Fusobacterium necrophorum subsp. funduliforme]